MKKILFLIIFALLPFAAFGSDQTPPFPQSVCSEQLPYGMPTIKAKHPIICRMGYILEHDPIAKIPNWVSWTLTPQHVIGCVTRDDAFAADASLPVNQRATPADYAGSGYDQGHLANNADMSWDVKVARESFYMSNMSPQLPSVNRGTWKNLEQAERAWVYSTKHTFTIYAGNVFSENSKKIGENKVTVPDYLYKILIDNATKKSYAFIFPHKNGLDQDFTKYQTTVLDIEAVSGIVFPIPDSKTVKNALLPVDLKSYADKKKEICK
jgi:endonuclease G